jgi:hypothetical protein
MVLLDATSNLDGSVRDQFSRPHGWMATSLSVIAIPRVRTHRITNNLDCDPSIHRRRQTVAPTQRLLGSFP